MAYRFTARSATPGEDRWTLEAIAELAAHAVATPTLAIADNGDGTGATATISGGDADATHTVYAAAWPGGSWVEMGDREGNGTVDLSLSLGPYTGYALAECGFAKACSNVVQFRASDTTPAIQYQCLERVRDVVRGLTLADVESASVVASKFPWTYTSMSAGVFCTPTAESNRPKTNVSNEIGYAVQVTCVQPSNEDLTGDLNRFLLWREQVRQAFKTPPADLTAIGVYKTLVEPRAVLLPEAFARQYDAGAVVIRCFVRE